MAISTRYVAKETAANLMRNRLMTVASILTIAVSLSLVGVALLLQEGVSNATVRWSNGVNVAVFLQADVTSSQSVSVHDQLVAMPEVRHCFYMNKQATYSEFKRLYANQPDVYESATPANMPPSYRCVLSNPKDAQTVQAQFVHKPGVRNVAYPGLEINTMEKVALILQIVFLSLALILFLSAFVLIANTIRQAIFARRREIAVMKLVGATNWFIRIPFMMEGFVQGIVGGLIAFGAIFFLHWGLGYLVNHAGAQILKTIVISSNAMFVTAFAVVIAGIVLGTAGSLIAIRRFLDV